MSSRGIPDRYTPFFDVMSDYEAREGHKKDQEEYFNPNNNSFSGQSDFVGTVLTPMRLSQNGETDSNVSMKFSEVYMSVGGISDNLLPPPCNFESSAATPEQRVKLYNYTLSCYPLAISRGSLDDQNFTGFRKGDVVNCNFEKGPSFLGRQRGLSFDGTRVSRDPGLNTNTCASAESVAASFGGGLESLGAYNANAGGDAESATAMEPMTTVDSQFAQPGLGAKFYSTSSKGKERVKHIMLHSTDGGGGPATGTLRRFAKGPTTSYDWKSPTGDEIKNPPWNLVSPTTGGKLPEGTVLRERKYAGKPLQKYVETKVKTSIHYAIDGLGEGNIYQGVAEKDVAHHGGNKNGSSIGIEMCGRPNRNPGKGATPNYSEMYNDHLLNNTAKLCADICKRYNLPVNKETIIGHEDYSSKRTDPGANSGNFDYTDFLARVQNYRNQMG